LWNECLGPNSKWFDSPWLLAECYMVNSALLVSIIVLAENLTVSYTERPHIIII
jgi:hypothetical protein